jgi:hypothetical protein
MEAVRRVSVRNWAFEKPEEHYSVRVERGGKPVPGLKSGRIESIEESVMTWRKANHIHAWFVDNVQNGQDNCGTYRVEWEQLQELLRACEDVIKGSELVDGIVWAGTVFDRDHPKGLALQEPARSSVIQPWPKNCFRGGKDSSSAAVSITRVISMTWLERATGS